MSDCLIVEPLTAFQLNLAMEAYMKAFKRN
jgi:hypothetical protein